MTSTTKRIVPLALVLFSPMGAIAQEASAPSVPADSQAAAAPADSQTPAAPAQAEPTPPAADAMKEKLDELATKLAALEEASEASTGDIKKLKKLKIGGFIQARYEWHKDAFNGVQDVKKNGNFVGSGSSIGRGYQSDFYIKRARLSVAHAGKDSEYLLSVDAGENQFSVKDVEASWIEPYTPLKLKFTLGQFKYTFGHEIGLSDTVRELPERAKMYGDLFKGDRDRGFRVSGQYDVLRFALSLINGNGSFTDTLWGYRDSNKYKDVVGRVGVDLGSLVGGLSAWYSPDTVYDPKNIYSSTAITATMVNDPKLGSPLRKYRRLRAGVDIQGYIDVPELGGLVLKGELVYSQDKNLAYNGVAADKCQDRVGLGYSLLAAQNLGDTFGLAVRYDSFDPLLQGSLDGCASQAAAKTDRVDRVGGAFLIHFSPNLRGTLAYEHPIEQTGKKVDNDIVTAQMMAKF